MLDQRPSFSGPSWNSSSLTPIPAFGSPRPLSPLLKCGKLASSTTASRSLGYARKFTSLFQWYKYYILKPCKTFWCLSLKGIRIWHPKLCHFGIRIILNWRQLRKSNHKKSSLTKSKLPLWTCPPFPYQEEDNNTSLRQRRYQDESA